MKKSSGSNRIRTALGVLAVVSAGTLAFFKSPYSKIKADFQKTATDLVDVTAPSGDSFTETDLAGLPDPVKKYFEYCGFIGTRKMSYMKATFKDVPFKMGKNRPGLTIDYTQYNFVAKPDRIALIESSLYGIPFQGFDAFVDGAGSMKGVVAKVYTLFDQRGEAMDRSSLVTYLAECFVIPSVILQDFITWESIDAKHAKATIAHGGISASGIFTFKENGEMLSFTTADREAAEIDGTSQKVEWTAFCSGYRERGGIKRPTILKAVWHYEEGDLIYFDGKDVQIEYDYEL